jgi:hypothetical protein
MNYDESYAEAFPFDKMIPDMLDSEMIEEVAEIVNEAIKEKVQVNLSINNRGGRNALLLAWKIADRFNSENKQRPF